MRILQVTDFFDPYNGGVEIHVRTIVDELAARGHEVAVATLPTAAEQTPRTGTDPIRVFEVEHLTARIGRGFSRAERPWAPPFPDPLAMIELRRVVRSFRPDVIHGHDWLARSVLPRLVSGSTPIVTSLHYYTRTCAKKTLWRDDEICSGPEPLRCLRCASGHYGAARGPVVALGVRVGAAIDDRRSARFISVSAATAAGNGLGRRPNATVIPNPLAPGALAEPAGHRGELPDGVPDGPFLLYVGDLRPEKGIHTLLAAVAELRSRYGSTIPLVLVGERTTSDLDLPPHTIEIGLVTHDVVQALWRRASVGVVPSRWPEPFGLVAIEAMAAGCPLVASAVGGLAEILADGRGVLVPPGDGAALAAAIDDLTTDPERRQTIGQAGRDSLERYELGRIVDAIEAEYQQAIDGRTRKRQATPAGAT